MRVHIISDMEGVAGIVKWQQTTGGEKPYDEGRVLYTEEINAAVRGATEAGATEIVPDVRVGDRSAGGGLSADGREPRPDPEAGEPA